MHKKAMLLVLFCLLALPAVLIGCEEKNITQSETNLPLTRSQANNLPEADFGVFAHGYEMDGIRVNGTEYNPQTKSEEQTYYFIGTNREEVHGPWFSPEDALRAANLYWSPKY